MALAIIVAFGVVFCGVDRTTDREVAAMTSAQVESRAHDEAQVNPSYLALVALAELPTPTCRADQTDSIH